MEIMKKNNKIIQKLLQILAYINKRVFVSGYHSKSFSQEGEDMVFKNIFQGQRKGFYVDIGAHHPKMYSNTYNFYMRGWRGVNIDALPGSMRLFNRIRKRDINIEKAISDTDQKLTYYAFELPAYNGFSELLSQQRIENGIRLKYKKSIMTSSLEKILDGIGIETDMIDFISLDIEGLELSALRSINLKKYTPKIIMVEILDFDLYSFTNNEIVNYLHKYDYSVYSKLIHSILFIKNMYLDSKTSRPNISIN